MMTFGVHRSSFTVHRLAPEGTGVTDVLTAPAKRRTPNVRTPNAERQTPNAERQTPNVWASYANN